MSEPRIETTLPTKHGWRYHEETWDEFYYRFEYDHEPCEYDDCIARIWINTKMDGTGTWIFIPHKYESGSHTCPAMAVIEHVTDKYWAGAPSPE